MHTDAALWIKISNDDHQAFAELFRVLFKRLYNYGRKFTADDSLIEDAAQETLMAVWTKRKTLSAIQFPTAYFFTSFRNSLTGKLKPALRFAGHDEINDIPEFAVDQLIIRKETDAQTAAEITKAVAALTSRQREAIFLRFYEGLPYEQVAGMLNITVKATYKIVARALEELRQALTVSGCFLLLFLSFATAK